MDAFDRKLAHYRNRSAQPEPSPVEKLITDLCDLYPQLKRALAPGSAASDGYSPSSKPSSRPAAVPQVSDLIRETDQSVDGIALHVRAHLGFQHVRPVTRSVWTEGWSISARICTRTRTEVMDYATIATLRALPPLLEAAGPEWLEAAEHDLWQLRSSARRLLGLDVAPMKFPAPCPGCFGFIGFPYSLRQTLRADAHEARVWCSNRLCGIECGNSSCWCAVPGGRKHRLVWNRSDLLRLSHLLETA